MKWSEISIHTTQEAVEPISNVFNNFGASGVVIEDVFDLHKERIDVYGEIYALNPDDYPTEGVIVKAYLPITDTLDETIKDIKMSITELSQFGIELGENVVSVNEVNEEDWATAWKKYYHPVSISDRITIVPTWEEYEKKSEEEIIIELDPGMAFGTGTHPTTVMCMKALEKYVQADDTIIDVGTGSGVLSIAAAKLGAKKIDAYDIDEVAVRSALENVTLNKENDVITVGTNSLLEGIESTVDIVVGNLLAEIILRFVHDAKRVVRPGGYFITSGIIAGKRTDIEEKLVAEGFEIVEVITMEDWVAIVAKA